MILKLHYKNCNIYKSIKELFSLDNLLKGKVLDIECKKGTYLKQLKKKNWEAYDIDISPRVDRECKKHRLNVFFEGLDGIESPEKYFDVIIMGHSIEHMYQLLEVLEEIYRMFKDNRIILIEMPNINSFDAGFFRCYWHHIDWLRHPYHFDFDALKVDQYTYSKRLVVIIKILTGKKNSKFLNCRFIRYLLQGLLYPLTSRIAKIDYGTSLEVIAKNRI